MNSILIVGKPNSGKSLLFNRLTGLSQKVANFPGVTVELKKGNFEDYEIIDFPGIYSMNPLTRDEEIAVEKFHEALHNNSIRTIVCNLDATRLERSLVFGIQAQTLAKEHKKPIVFVLNMMDEIEKRNLSINTNEFQKLLGSPVFGISAKTQKGLEEFKSELKRISESPENFLPTVSIEDREQVLSWAKELGEKFGVNPGIILKKQNRLDKFFLNSFLGGVIFFLIMAFLFQSIFTWAAPLMDLVESSIASLGEWTTSSMSDGAFKDFLNDAIFGGFGSFLVFVPQIMVLTFIIGILEDSGYLSRASVIVHKPLSKFGLTGKSFVPYLSGFACAIPAMMAARTIESPRKRLITILTIPLMACSARLPVYSLLIAALIPATPYFGGLITTQGLTFFGIYLFGLLTALIISALLNKFAYKEESDSPFIIELTPYRLPHFKPLILKSFNSGKSFVMKAGAIIFTVNAVVWLLGYFPNGAGNLDSSWLSSIGKLIDPIFAPLDLDWRYGVAILASFLAREVFVGTLGTLFGIEGADEDIEGLASKISASGMTLGTGLGLLVFYAIALQCVATVAMMKKEIGNVKGPALAFVSYSVLAYVMALMTKFIF